MDIAWDYDEAPLKEEEYHPYIQVLFYKYAPIFGDIPSRLLLDGGFQHTIELELRSRPIMITPYCHFCAFKDEIED